MTDLVDIADDLIQRPDQRHDPDQDQTDESGDHIESDIDDTVEQCRDELLTEIVFNDGDQPVIVIETDDGIDHRIAVIVQGTVDRTSDRIGIDGCQDAPVFFGDIVEIALGLYVIDKMDDVGLRKVPRLDILRLGTVDIDIHLGIDEGVDVPVQKREYEKDQYRDRKDNDRQELLDQGKIAQPESKPFHPKRYPNP